MEGRGGDSSKEELHPPSASQAAKNRERPSVTIRDPPPIWPDDLWSHARWCPVVSSGGLMILTFDRSWVNIEFLFAMFPKALMRECYIILTQ